MPTAGSSLQSIFLNKALSFMPSRARSSCSEDEAGSASRLAFLISGSGESEPGSVVSL